MKSKKKVHKSTYPKQSLMIKNIADIDTNLGNDQANEGWSVSNKVQIHHPHTTKS